MINEAFYVTLDAKACENKPQRQTLKPYLVVSSDDVNEHFQIVNDANVFDKVSKHLCYFAGFVSKGPVVTTESGNINEIVKTIEEIIKRLDNIDIQLLADDLAKETDENAKQSDAKVREVQKAVARRVRGK